MAQIAGNRSEFTTSDLVLNDIEYKRNGGCFLSHKKTAAIVVMFIVGVVTAGVIGAYLGPWTRKRALTALALSDDDEINERIVPSKFSVSPSILPNAYTIELTPVVEGSVKRIRGRVVIRFANNETQPIPELVMNARNITVFQVKLLSLDPPSRNNDQLSRVKRDAEIEVNNNSSETETNSSVPFTEIDFVTSFPDTTLSGSSVDSTNATVSVDTTEYYPNVTSVDYVNETTLSNYNATSDDGPVEVSENATTLLEDYIKTNVTDSVNVESAPETTKVPMVHEQEMQNVSSIATEFPTIEPSRPSGNLDQAVEIPVDLNKTDALDGFYVIYLDTSLHRGEYSIEITYEAVVDGSSIFSAIYDDDGQQRWLLATNLKQYGSNGLYPGFGDYQSTARYELTITRPNNMTALTSTPLRTSEVTSDNWMTDHFLQSEQTSSRDLMFVLSDLKVIKTLSFEDGRIPAALWGRNEFQNATDFIATKIVQVIEQLSEFLATKFPTTKLDVVAMPGITEAAIGGTGLISIKESLFYLSDESVMVVRERALGNLISQIGEQWLGGLGSKMKDDSWISEGSLIYFQYLLSGKIDPTYNSFDSFGILQHDVLEIDGYDVSRTLRVKAGSSNFDSTIMKNIYSKGACLIRMLHYLVSDVGFRNGYRKFLSQWGNGTVDISAFWDAMFNEGQWLPDGTSLAEVMLSWTTQGGFPVITVSRNYEMGTTVIRQEKFSYNKDSSSSDQLWFVPVTYLFDGDDWSSPKKLWMNRQQTVSIDGKPYERKWAIFNVDRAGYYRVNYDSNNWELLSLALNSTFETFSVATRTALVDDALSLAWGERLEYSTALNLIRYLRETETHHAPWVVALRNMIKLNNVFRNTGAYLSFQRFMVKFVTPLFEKIMVTESGTQLHFVAVQWACLVDHPECRSYLTGLSNVPSHLEETHGCMKAKFGGVTDWGSLIHKISMTDDKSERSRIISVLPCFRDEWILQTLLSDILKDDKFDSDEVLVLLRSFDKNPTAARTMFNFVRRKWDQISVRFARSYPILRAFIVASMKGLIDDQDLRDFQIFKEDNYDRLKWLGHTINVGEMEARSRSNWIKRNAASVQKLFDSYE